MARSATRPRSGLGAVLYTVLCTSTVLCTTGAGAEAPAAGQVITVVIDASNLEAAREAVQDLAAALPMFPTQVDIHLTILPDATGVLGVELVPAGGNSGDTVGCEAGSFGRLDGEYSEIRLPALQVYTHLSLEMDLAGQDARSGLVLSCDYQGTEAPVFRIMGRFIASKTTIPTAADVLLVAMPVR